MAIYRSDQALVTIGSEPAEGAYQEIIRPDTVTTTTTLTKAHNAGSRSIKVTSASGFAVGNYIRIGYTLSGADDGEHESEIRRIVALDGSRLYLDAPTGFYHATNENVALMTVSSGLASYPTDIDNNVTYYSDAIRFVPGVYETVEVPDPEPAIEPSYVLGTSAHRNATLLYRGVQTFAGSIPTFKVLNGWPLRFPVGKLVSVPADTSAVTDATATYDGSPSFSANKGDMLLTLPVDGSDDIYAAVVLDNGTPADNRSLLYINDANGNTEVVQVIEKVDDTDNVVRLANPLRFDHTGDSSNTVTISLLDAASNTYTHTITETSDLDSISMHVHMRDSAEDSTYDFDRRYFGGRIGSATIEANEGEMLAMSWTGIQFMGMNHNQRQEAGYGTSGSNGVQYMPRFNFMQSITDTEAWFPSVDVTDASPRGSAAAPYYFSQGRIKLFGLEVATVRSFVLTINNNPEGRPYIGSQGNQRHRGPYENVNQRRDYSLTMQVVEPNSRLATVSSSSGADLYGEGTTSIFKELLLEGDRTGEFGSSTPDGFTFEIVFARDGQYDDGTDYIKVEPSFASGSTPSYGLNQQGLMIQSAKFNLDGSNPIQADLEIVLRGIKITIEDSNPIYP